jgi:tripartite-type tricarboxylate transporter receptor subunit TctC
MSLIDHKVPGLRPTRRGLFGLGLGALALSTTARAAAYPERPIELIVPWGPGGGADQLGRKVAQLWEPLLKVSLPVVNVPGASGVTGLAKMLAAPRTATPPRSSPATRSASRPPARRAGGWRT